jgi:hypothetical protein
MRTCSTTSSTVPFSAPSFAVTTSPAADTTKKLLVKLSVNRHQGIPQLPNAKSAGAVSRVLHMCTCQESPGRKKSNINRPLLHVTKTGLNQKHTCSTTSRTVPFSAPSFAVTTSPAADTTKKLLVKPSVNAPSRPIKMTSFTSRGCCCSNACRCRTHSLSLALALTRGRPLQQQRRQQYKENGE